MIMLQKTVITGILLIVVMVGAVQPSCAQTDINFDNLSDLTVVTNQYSNLGVTFTGAVILTCGQSLNCPQFPPFSFPNVIYDGINGIITATFDLNIAGNITQVTARVTGNRNITMTAFDASGNVLATAETGGPNYVGVGSPNMLLTVQTSGPPIAMVTFHDSGNTYTVDDFTFFAGLRIIQPKDQDQFSLTQSSFTATSPVAFQAGPIAPSATIQWTAQLQYATSGGRGGFNDTRNFTTDQTTVTHNETYTGIGGQVTVQANQNTPPVAAKPVTIYIVGTAIPDSNITSRLDSLYGGATPNLMTGIAERESTYQQFATTTLFGISALWPHESFDGGSHIGLMQMPTNQANAWDWTANTSNGVNLFNSKLASAGRLATRIIASHKGLRQLTGVELEHMAVVLYGPYASGNLSAQYYAPVPTANGGWDWAVNTTGNPKGVAYAKFVFSNTR